MDKISVIGLYATGLIVLIGLSVISYVAVKRDIHTIEQSDNLSVLCMRAYKSELKDDQRVQEICRDVQIKLFDEEGK